MHNPERTHQLTAEMLIAHDGGVTVEILRPEQARPIRQPSESRPAEAIKPIQRPTPRYFDEPWPPELEHRLEQLRRQEQTAAHNQLEAA